ncbi:MAG: tRNA preQ1(34) S-adenosylmethionine ribosyltransferase-isomerase QueA [Candidatus Omnitrophica bacterium]|nr:tRNA preQ1(34) S-adenosylmethionine ribosyltransferase-isomerase QueA [Candidatus Omnitrophota bacterium]
MLKLSRFDYTLPKELIAQYPLKERDACRLLILERKSSNIEHRVFKDIINYLNKGDLLVLNDTRVLPSRLIGRRPTGGKAEVLLLKQKDNLLFEALIRPARIKIGEKLIFNDGSLSCEVSGRNELRFSSQESADIYKLGLMPLPPYIKRAPIAEDAVYYQTVYAKKDGSVASPTAGIHFTPQLLTEISEAGINIAYVTLHINYATFKPVKSEDVTRHRMQEEYFFLPEDTIKAIENTRLSGGRIIAVGTTSCRALETYQATGRKDGLTSLFIYPGYKFKAVDCLLTNFHLPRTTLFLLVCAFCAAGASASGRAGEKLLKKAYQQAINEKYRFYSYGDAMLIV